MTGLAPKLHLLETLIRLTEARARADLRQVFALIHSIDSVPLNLTGSSILLLVSNLSKASEEHLALA